MATSLHEHGQGHLLVGGDRRRRPISGNAVSRFGCGSVHLSNMVTPSQGGDMVIIRFFQLGRALAVIGFPVLALNCASASRSPWVPVTRVSPPLKVKEVVSVVPDNQRTVTDRTYVVRYEPEKRCVETTTGRIERSTHTFSKGTFLTHLGVISAEAAGLTALVCKDASGCTRPSWLTTRNFVRRESVSPCLQGLVPRRMPSMTTPQENTRARSLAIPSSCTSTR